MIGCAAESDSGAPRAHRSMSHPLPLLGTCCHAEQARTATAGLPAELAHAAPAQLPGIFLTATAHTQPLDPAQTLRQGQGAWSQLAWAPSNLTSAAAVKLTTGSWSALNSTFSTRICRPPSAISDLALKAWAAVAVA